MKKETKIIKDENKCKQNKKTIYEKTIAKLNEINKANIRET